MYIFDAELLEAVCCKMKRCKAAGLDELTIEYLVNSHPVLISILARLFNLIILFRMFHTDLDLVILYRYQRRTIFINVTLLTITRLFPLALSFLRFLNIAC